MPITFSACYNSDTLSSYYVIFEIRSNINLSVDASIHKCLTEEVKKTWMVVELADEELPDWLYYATNHDGEALDMMYNKKSG